MAVKITDFILLKVGSLNPVLSSEGAESVADVFELSHNMFGSWSNRGKKKTSLKEGRA